MRSPTVSIQFLAVQKFTNELLPRLMKNAQESSGTPVVILLPMLDLQKVDPVVQTAYLVGLSSLIRVVPKATYVHEMSAVSKPFSLPLYRLVDTLLCLSSSCRCYFVD